MPRIVKILLLAVVLPLLVIVGLLLAVPYLVNVDGYAPHIAARLEPALGRKVRLGHIRLSLLPLSLVAEKVGVSEDPAFGSGDFVTMDALRIEVSLVGLLNRQIDITTLEADRPVVKAVKKATGVWNFDSLGAEVTAAPSGSPAPKKETTQGLEIAKLRLNDGSFSLDDLSGPKPAHMEFDHVTASAEHLASGKAFEFLLAVKFTDGELQTSGSAGPFIMSVPPSLPLQLHAKLENVDIVKLYGSDSPIRGRLSGTIEIDHDGKVAKITGQATVQQFQTNAKSRPSPIPVSAQFQAEYMPLTENLSLQKIDLTAGQAAIAITGLNSRRLPESNRLSVKAANAPLADFGKLLPALGVILPNNSSITSGALTLTAELTGPLTPMNGTVTISVANAKWSGYSLTGKVSEVARFVGLPSTRDTEVQSLKGDAHFVNGAATFSNLAGVMPGLSITGGGTMNAQDQLNLKMQAQFTSGGTAAQVISSLAGTKGVPFAVTGPIDNPQFAPDVAGAGQRITSLKDLAGQGGGNLGKTLGGLLKKKNP